MVRGVTRVRRDCVGVRQELVERIVCGMATVLSTYLESEISNNCGMCNVTWSKDMKQWIQTSIINKKP